MFIFRWFHIFESSYVNGFCDGASYGSILWIGLFVIRVCYVWQVHVLATRAVIQSFLFEVKWGEATMKSIENFRACIVSDDILNAAQKARIFEFCDLCMAVEQRKSNHMVPKRKQAVEELQAWLNQTEFPLFRLFFAHPFRNLWFALPRCVGKAA